MSIYIRPPGYQESQRVYARERYRARVRAEGREIRPRRQWVRRCGCCDEAGHDVRNCQHPRNTP